VGAYLLALDALATDGRWPRDAAETPRHHAARVADDATRAPLARLAAAYQLLRYAERPLTDRERARSANRLANLERAIRHSR
jgi:hypothetical protein